MSSSGWNCCTCSADEFGSRNSLTQKLEVNSCHIYAVLNPIVLCFAAATAAVVLVLVLLVVVVVAAGGGGFCQMTTNLHTKTEQ